MKSDLNNVCAIVGDIYLTIWTVFEVLKPILLRKCVYLATPLPNRRQSSQICDFLRKWSCFDADVHGCMMLRLFGLLIPDPDGFDYVNKIADRICGHAHWKHECDILLFIKTQITRPKSLEAATKYELLIRMVRASSSARNVCTN